jgi:dihydroorotase
MGSSTGNMLVDNKTTLENIFSKSKLLIAVHCEDETTIRRNTAEIKEKYGDKVDASIHPVIRNAEACYISSSMAVELAKKYNTRLHILHISTAIETALFRNDIPLNEKRITAEACIHHLWFSDEDYKRKGNYIKWNPAVKSAADRAGIWKALLDDRIDIIATDHAPHTIEEKEHHYYNAPSGGPLVQHSLPALIEFYHQGKISLEKIAEKAAHNVAVCFQIEKRGFIREGYFADLVLVDINKSQTVTKENTLYKCGWSPFEGETLHGVIKHTFVSGHHVFANGKFDESQKGKRLQFTR